MQGTNAAVTARFKIKEPSVSSSLRRVRLGFRAHAASKEKLARSPARSLGVGGMLMVARTNADAEDGN